MPRGVSCSLVSFFSSPRTRTQPRRQRHRWQRPRQRWCSRHRRGAQEQRDADSTRVHFFFPFFFLLTGCSWRVLTRYFPPPRTRTQPQQEQHRRQGCAHHCRGAQEQRDADDTPVRFFPFFFFLSLAVRCACSLITHYFLPPRTRIKPPSQQDRR